MYFITKRTSKTGKKFQVIENKAKLIHKEQVKLSKEYGFEAWRDGNWVAFGGFSSLIFKKAPDPKLYKKVNRNEWMPKRNTKEGKEIHNKLRGCPEVSKHDLNQCIGYDGAPYKTIGYAPTNDEYFGFIVDYEWEFRDIPLDCEEVTRSRYEELF